MVCLRGQVPSGFGRLKLKTKLFRIVDMSSIKTTARLAGSLYLAMGILAWFSMIYVPSVFLVRGDAT
ncbi:MAG: hypothetical protein QOH22_236, partial [Gemmatimonadaceae bacterium]|nr:hypothetical protein [Gemmatimonadaceae bacterium]